MSNDIVIFDKEQAIARAKNHNEIVVAMRTNVLIKDHDYGIIPGTGNKPTLLKPGAEKLCSAFGLAPDFELIEKVENWDTDKPLFNYKYKCHLIHIETGKLIATGIGSCNSLEKKYRWRWLWPNEVKELDTSDMVARKTQNGVTQYRAPNDDIFSQVNTIDKMACKRALIAAVLIGCNASDHFTQDIEDMKHLFAGDVVDGEFAEVDNGGIAKWTPESIKSFIEKFTSRFPTTHHMVALKDMGVKTLSDLGTGIEARDKLFDWCYAHNQPIQVTRARYSIQGEQKCVVFDAPMPILAYGRSTKFKVLAGDWYEANNFGQFTERNINTEFEDLNYPMILEYGFNETDSGGYYTVSGIVGEPPQASKRSDGPASEPVTTNRPPIREDDIPF